MVEGGAGEPWASGRRGGLVAAVWRHALRRGALGVDNDSQAEEAHADTEADDERRGPRACAVAAFVGSIACHLCAVDVEFVAAAAALQEHECREHGGTPAGRGMRDDESVICVRLAVLDDESVVAVTRLRARRGP